MQTNLTLNSLTKLIRWQWLLVFCCLSGIAMPASATTDSKEAFYSSYSCPTPSGLYATNITSTSAQVGWSNSSGASYYWLQYRVAAGGNWTTVQVSSNSYYLISLQPGTVYQFQVATQCYNGENSGYSYPWSFTTTGSSCQVPTWLMAGNITCYSAHLSWDIMPGAASYTVEYKSENDYTWTGLVTVNTNYFDMLQLLPNTWYQWRVKTNCAYGGSSPYSAIQTFGTTYCQGCDAPGNLTVYNINYNSATLSWSPTYNAAYYVVEYRMSNQYANWTSVIANGTSLVLNNLYANTSYEWRVKTHCYNNNESNWSYISNFTTQYVNCYPPTWLSTTNIQCNMARANWDPIPGAYSYYIQWKESGSNTWTYSGTTNGNFFDMMGLFNNTSYVWRVRVNCGNGNQSAFSNYVYFATNCQPACTIPTNLTATNITNNSATLGWSNIPGATNYTIQYQVSNSGNWITVNSVNNWYALGNLQNNTSYTFHVKAICNGGWSDYSYNFTFTTGGYSSCPIPTWTMENNITSTSAVLSWDAMPGACSYTVEWKATNSSTWNSSNLQPTQLYLTNLQSCTQYQWRVRTNCCNSGYSSFSNVRTFSTDCYQSCVAPTGLQSSNITGSSAVLSWGAVFGANYYEVRYKPTNSNNWITITVNGTSTTINNLLSNTTYWWYVRSSCNNGSFSPWSYEANFTTGGYQGCNAPTGLTASNITGSSAVLSWGAVFGANYYEVRYKPTNSNSWITITVNGTSTTINNLLSNTTYWWYVRSSCSNGTFSPWSYEANFTTGGYQGCNAPTGLTTSNITGSSAVLAWGAVFGANYYEVRYKPTNSNSWITITVNGTSTTINNLLSNTTYWWYVRSSCNNGSFSPWSNEATFTTGGYQGCDAPTGLAAYNITGSSAALSWNVVAGANFYEVRYKPTNSNTWITITVFGTSTTVNNLLNNTTYWWYVRASCYNGNLSPWSYESNFSTTGYWCSAPTWLSETNITNSSATVNWDPVQNAGSYFVQWRYANSNQWIGSATVFGNSYTIQGLNQNTSYVWQVRTNCYNGDYSEFSALEYFTTNGAPTCAIPSYLWVNNITGNSAVVGWNTVYGAVNYTVEYQVSGSGNINTVTTSSNNVLINNLTPGTTYTFRVRSNCGNGYYSAYSYMLWFTTTGGYCGIPNNTYEGPITYNTANLNWSAVNGAISYTLQYKIVGAVNWNQTTVGTNTVTLATLQANTTYLWRVKANCGNGYYSDFTPTDQFTTANYNGNLPNDNPCGAYSLPTSTMCSPAGATNVGATNTTSPPPPSACSYNGGDIWFVTTVPAGGMVTIHTSAGTMNDIVLALYTGNCNSLSYVTCVDDYNGSTMPSIMYTGTPGTVLYIRVWGYGGNQGTFNICATAAVGDLKIDMGDTYLNEETDLVKADIDGIDSKLDLKQQMEFVCYPNPSNRFITVEVPENDWNGTQVSIIDMQG
ncbi:MAG: fibronectin type III domain-containing protein, partial [Saprospiraceae bacterium]